MNLQARLSTSKRHVELAHGRLYFALADALKGLKEGPL